MKYFTIYLDDNKIEIFNSILGKETIKVNKEIVSAKFSIIGTKHNFSIIENGTPSNCKIITRFGLNGVKINFYKNDKPIIETPKNGSLAISLLVIIIFGIIIYSGLLDRLFQYT